MKNLILDSPFKDSFSDYMVKGESIIWEGQPVSINYLGNDDTSDDYETHRLITMLFIGIILFLSWINGPFLIILVFAMLFFFAIVLPKLNRKNKRNFTYAITQNQILFQFKEKWSRKIVLHSIPFSEIKDIIVVMTYDVEKIKADYRNAHEAIPEMYNRSGLEKIGTIFIVPHHPESIKFDTVNLQNNDKRHLPTLELLDDAKSVTRLILERIRNTNMLL